MLVRSYVATPFVANNLRRHATGLAGFNALQRALDDVFDMPVSKSAGLPVRLDVCEDENAFHITADLPVTSERDVAITFDDGTLTIAGEKKLTRKEQGGTWHMSERAAGSFKRQLSLPDTVDAAKIEAKFDKGELTITVPKAPLAAPTARTIEIKGA